MAFRHVEKQIVVIIIFLAILATPVIAYRGYVSITTTPTPTPTPPPYRELEVSEEARFFLSEEAGFYDAWVRIKNPNRDFGVDRLSYRFEFYDAAGTLLTTERAESFILPSEEKYFVAPGVRIIEEGVPTRVKFMITDALFVKVTGVPTLTLRIFNQRYEPGKPRAGETRLSAEIENGTFFHIKEVSVEVLLFNEANEIAAVNATRIGELIPNERRAFSVHWNATLPREFRPLVIFAVNPLRRGNVVPVFEERPGR
ncbi:MAG: hypothetical protein HY459_02195 [Parcubacteria group bacterium]|nr:hypothetical protein [Parcubacteria group bacterium]